MNKYGNALKEQRIAAGLSQSELSKKTGLKQQMISWWEAGKGFPNIDFCVVLADFYGITIDELIGREQIPKTYTKYNINTINNNGKMELK